jgi:hypothetical protein
MTDISLARDLETSPEIGEDTGIRDIRPYLKTPSKTRRKYRGSVDIVQHLRPSEGNKVERQLKRSIADKLNEINRHIYSLGASLHNMAEYGRARSRDLQLNLSCYEKLRDVRILLQVYNESVYDEETRRVQGYIDSCFRNTQRELYGLFDDLAYRSPWEKIKRGLRKFRVGLRKRKRSNQKI